MDVEQLKKRYDDLIWDLFREEFLDEYFKQLRSLPSNEPQFMFDMTSLYFGETEKLLNDLSNMLNEHTVDFEMVEESLLQLKGSTSSMGFRRVCIACVALSNGCKEKNQEIYSKLLQQLKEEHSLLKRKLESLFALEQQIVEAGGSIPVAKRL